MKDTTKENRPRTAGCNFESIKSFYAKSFMKAFLRNFLKEFRKINFVQRHCMAKMCFKNTQLF